MADDDLAVQDIDGLQAYRCCDAPLESIERRIEVLANSVDQLSNRGIRSPIAVDI